MTLERKTCTTLSNTIIFSRLRENPLIKALDDQTGLFDKLKDVCGPHMTTFIANLFSDGIGCNVVRKKKIRKYKNT